MNIKPSDDANTEAKRGYRAKHSFIEWEDVYWYISKEEFDEILKPFLKPFFVKNREDNIDVQYYMSSKNK